MSGFRADRFTCDLDIHTGDSEKQEAPVRHLCHPGRDDRGRNGESSVVSCYVMLILALQVGDRNNSYQDFLNDLHQKDGDADDCRYGVYDYDYQFNPDGAESG